MRGIPQVVGPAPEPVYKLLCFWGNCENAGWRQLTRALKKTIEVWGEVGQNTAIVVMDGDISLNHTR